MTTAVTSAAVGSALDAANDPSHESWVDVPDDSQFPVQNIPFGIGRLGDGPPRALVRIGDHVVDLAGLAAGGRLDTAPAEVFLQPSLNAFLALGRPVWTATRLRLAALLQTGQARREVRAVAEHLHPVEHARLHLPVQVSDFTDFFSNPHHARRSIQVLRPGTDIPPNWWQVPVGYHARCATVVPSGEAVPRPWGVVSTEAGPQFAPSRALDFELEVGFIVGVGNPRGRPVAIQDFRDHVFGAALLNDWSARDLQRFESTPLGPFLGKSFATSLAPWVVTLDALEPFMHDPPGQVPEPPRHLRGDPNPNLDIHLEARLATSAMCAAGEAPVRVASASFTTNHWTPAQQLAHLTVNGAATRTGDLYGSGTVSGPDDGSAGCLLELTSGGRRPLRLPNGETRAFLDDGDEVELAGWAQHPNGPRIGMGTVTGQVLPTSDPTTIEGRSEAWS